MARIDGFFIWPFLCLAQLLNFSRDCLRHYAADYKINWYGDSGKKWIGGKKTIIKIVLSMSFYESIKKGFFWRVISSEEVEGATKFIQC